MGIFSDARQDALEELTLAQLKALAKDKGIQVSGSWGSAPTKSDYVNALWGEDKKVSMKLIKAAKEEGSVEKAVKKGKVALTPTIASQKSEPMVSLEDVLLYLEQYKFISFYGSEKEYEIELAGALRERFGTVIRQKPVGVDGKRLTIDLDVAGVGIELKYQLKATDVRNALGQIRDYKRAYGDRIVILCIQTPGNEVYKNEIRELGVHFIEK